MVKRSTAVKNFRGLSSDWATAWLESVADGTYTMSQRKLLSVEQRGGGVAAVRKIARKHGIHLLQLTDDHGTEFIAASKTPFKIVC